MQIYPVPNSHTFLIDTPGFDDPQRSDTDILQSIASCLADLYEGLLFESAEISLSGIIYIHAINEVRMTGPMMKNLRILLHLAGEGNMQHLVLTTSKWGVEDAKTAQDRERELTTDAKYWKGHLAAGAKMRRYDDSQASALSIIALATEGGMFIPQLTQEYIISGAELCYTAAGRAIDHDMAIARDRHETELLALRHQHSLACDAREAAAAAQLQQRTLRVEAKLKVMDDEMNQLRTTRSVAQERADELDLLVSRRHRPEDATTAAHNTTMTTSARKKRALRWFARFAATGTAVAMSVLTHGAMVPAGLALVVGVNRWCQAEKDRELKKKKKRLKEKKTRIKFDDDDDDHDDDNDDDDDDNE